MVSVVIVTFNDERAVKWCVNSIRKYTHTPHEIIVVDNGSRDGTDRYLKKNTHLRVISNGKNLGLQKALNQGFAASRGEFLLKLDNDVIVTPGWLEGMLKCLKQDSNIGLVGPLSNVAVPHQVFKKALFSFVDRDYFYKKMRNILGYQDHRLEKMGAYHDPEGLEAFYQCYFRNQAVCFQEAPFLSGFCMLMPRKIFFEIGPFDERFRFTGFDDFDYSLRVWLAGYKIGIARHVYIHHEGSRSFYMNKLSLSSILTQGAKQFVRKWRRVPEAMKVMPAMLNVYKWLKKAGQVPAVNCK